MHVFLTLDFLYGIFFTRPWSVEFPKPPPHLSTSHSSPLIPPLSSPRVAHPHPRLRSPGHISLLSSTFTCQQVLGFIPQIYIKSAHLFLLPSYLGHHLLLPALIQTLPYCLPIFTLVPFSNLFFRKLKHIFNHIISRNKTYCYCT